MNEEKFEACLKAYVEHCLKSTWVKDESYKFYFANWLSRKVVIGVQTPEKILSLCRDSLKQDYSLKKDLSKIGVQFLQKSGKEKLSVPISISDVEIVKYLRKNEIPDESFFKDRGTSYTGLSGWLGTLLPSNFLPVVTTDFHESISYLFDLTDFPERGYPFFKEAQNYFQETKKYLKQRDLDQLFLANIISYLQQEYPNVQKKHYEETDWNWLTQDFHLYIFRNYLNDIPSKNATTNQSPVKPNYNSKDDIADSVAKLAIDFHLELYQPVIFTYGSDDPAAENRDLKFDKDYYLKRYQNQLEKGSWAEEVVKMDEINYLVRCGRLDLVECVQIVSENPDLGYDIVSCELDGTPKQIEVKSISAGDPKKFFMSASELRKSIELSNYYLYCVSSINNQVQKIYRLKSPDLNNQDVFRLTPTNYEVSFL